MIIKSLAISGTSSALPLASDTSKAKWIQLFRSGGQLQ